VTVGFQDDDFLHFYNLATLDPFRFMLLPHGNHPHALRNLVVVGMRGLLGLQPEAFMACVLLTHLLNVVLCYRIGVRLTRDPYVATVAAGLWAVAYTSSGTLGWYSVYGQVLATTALGGVLLLITRRTDEGRTVDATTVLYCVLLSWAGAFCFGTGIGLAIALPAVVVLLAPEVLAHRSTRWLLALGPLGVVALYFVYRALGMHYIGTDADELPGTVRLATWWDWNVALFWYIARSGPTELLSPFADAPALPTATGGVVLLALVGSVIAHDRRGSIPALRQMAALALCALSTYAMIALGRGYLGARAMTATRYHYVAQFPIALLLAVATARLASMLRLAWRRGAAAACIVALAIVVAVRERPVPAASAYTRARLADLRAGFEAIAHAVPSGDTAYVRNRRLSQAGWLVGMDSPEFPGLAAFFCILFPDNVVDGRQMRFVEANPAVRAAAEGRPRVSALLVAAAPPGAVLH
jgi:hypothetical protein